MPNGAGSCPDFRLVEGSSLSIRRTPDPPRSVPDDEANSTRCRSGLNPRMHTPSEERAQPPTTTIVSDFFLKLFRDSAPQGVDPGEARLRLPAHARTRSARDSRVPPSRIVEALDEVEDRDPCLLEEPGPLLYRRYLPRQVGEMPARRREEAHDVDGRASLKRPRQIALLLDAEDDERPLALPIAEVPLEGAPPMLESLR